MSNPLATFKKMEQERNRSSGFSLIETIIASTVVFLLILCLIQIILQSAVIKSRTGDRFLSVLIVRNKLEELKSLSFDSPGLQEIETQKIVTPQGLKKSYSLSWKIQDMTAGKKKIEAVCSPTNRAGAVVRVELYILRDLGF
jgi:competence protein ComGC